MRLRSLSTNVLVAAVALGLGVMIARVGADRRPATLSPSPAASPAGAPPAAIAQVDPAALRREIRAALRELEAEAQAQAAAQAPAAPEAAPSPAAAPPFREPTPTEAEAIARVHTRIDGVLAQGHLTSDDARALRMDMIAMPPDQAHAIRLKVAQAVNRDRLRVDDPLDLP